MSVETVIDTLTALDLGAHADPVAAHLCDSGFEDFVPLSNLIKLLRDAGVPPARAITVKNTVAQSLPVASPVRCARAVELFVLCVSCGRWRPAGWCSHAHRTVAASSPCPCARGVPLLLL